MAAGALTAAARVGSRCDSRGSSQQVDKEEEGIGEGGGGSGARLISS